MGRIHFSKVNANMYRADKEDAVMQWKTILIPCFAASDGLVYITYV